MKNLLLLLVLATFSILGAQNLPTMKYIAPGTATMGGGYQYAVKDYYMVLLGNDEQYASINHAQTTIGEVPKENNPSKRVTMAGFYLSETEVSNAHYREFLMDSLLTPTEKSALKAKLKSHNADSAAAIRRAWQPLIDKAAAAALLPDTNCWVTDFVFASNEPLVKHYLWHPAFDQYPVVGVSWDHAKAYCAWLTDEVNTERAAKKLMLLPAFRLPTEMEWEFAAREFERKDDKNIFAYNFPWKSTSVLDEHGQFRANIKTGPGDYIGDNYEYTAPVKSFSPNSKGLYQMAGNVSEWCEDVFRVNSDGNADANPPSDMAPRPIRLFEASNAQIQDEARVVKGGSWAEFQYAAMAGSRMGWPQARGGSRIGFRVAQTKMGCSCEHADKCKHQVLR